METDPASLLKAYQGQEKAFIERRFPLRFTPEIPVIRELYNQAKGLRWDPTTDIPWARFDPDALADDVREAARLTWSRRAWSTYPGIGENTALLVRLCLESGALGMDAKLFLSFRPAEEAKHLEVCFMLAERLGGYMADPVDIELRELSNHPFAQAALDKELPIEAFVAALGALDDQLELNLATARLQSSRNEVMRQALRLIATDKQRHVMFAWGFLDARLSALAAAEKAIVIDAICELVEEVIFVGYRNACLLPSTIREVWLEADELAAKHGLGASSAEMERRILRVTVAQLRERLAVWGLVLPQFEHTELGII